MGGVTGMKDRAAGCVWWPRIGQEIEDRRRRCTGCSWMTPSNPAPTPNRPVSPDYPMQSLCCDKAHIGNYTYFVLVDRFSNWPSVYQTSGGTAKELVQFLRKHFENFGVPEDFTSDGGLEFAAHETQAFLKRWGVTQRLTSAYYPRANTSPCDKFSRAILE